MIMMAAMFLTTCAVAQESNENSVKNAPAITEKPQMKKMPRKPMDPTAKMARELDLTPEQMTKVRELNAKYPELFRHHGRPHHPHQKDMKAKKDFKKIDGKKKFEGKKFEKKKMDPTKHKEIREKYDKELKGILSKKQFKKYNELQEKRKNFRDQRPPMEPKKEAKN